MQLAKYKKKRKFDKTPEPKGVKKSTGKILQFVVQKHAASRMHYDFRLEAAGVLKSWAVPKGPSLNPHDKRLAMMVEDHPFDYKDFEGTIPKGNYGAGEVIVWDRGNYLMLGASNVLESEKLFKQDLRKGHITFVLNGRKLKGEFALIKLRKAEENAWVLVKKDDGYASQKDVLKKDKSVVSGKKLRLKKK